jgi:hypothetical protein
MRLLVLGVLVLGLATAVPAAADPTPAPSPGYQIPAPSGPMLPGVQTYPPRCLAQPLACGLRYGPGTGTWNPRD